MTLSERFISEPISLPANSKQGIMMHTCDPALGKLRQEDYEFKPSLGNIIRPYLKKQELVR